MLTWTEHQHPVRVVPFNRAMSPMSCVVLLMVTCVVTVLSSLDQVRYDINTQARCTEVSRSATRNCVWPAGLNTFADQIAEQGRIVAYRIRWSRGWSEWYVPGVNDIDGKYNRRPLRCSRLPYRRNTLRRMWSYFYDHTHKFIICKPQ